MIFEKKTKWQPLATYNASGKDYIILSRRGLKSGMLYFKTKSLSPSGVCSYLFREPITDIKKQFEEILNSEI